MPVSGCFGSISPGLAFVWIGTCPNWHSPELALVWIDTRLDWHLPELALARIGTRLNWHLKEAVQGLEQLQLLQLPEGEGLVDVLDNDIIGSGALHVGGVDR